MYKYILAVLLMIGLLAACTNQPETEEVHQIIRTVPSTTEAVPTPEPGKAMVLGRVLSIETSEPVVDALVKLGRIERKDGLAVFGIDEAYSPGDYTDERGFFLVSNLDPAEYAIVIGDAYTRYVIITEDNNRNAARVWNVAPDQTLDVGELHILSAGLP